MKHPKTPSDRHREALEIAKQLSGCGLPFDDPRVAQLRDDLQRFAEDGVGASKVLKLPELKVAMVVKLSLQAHIPSFVRVTKL